VKIDRKEIFNIAATLGVALLFGGYVRYSVQEVMSPLTKWILIAGGVLLAAGLAGNFRQVMGFFGSRAGKLGTNTAVLSLAVIGILAVVNFLGYRHPKRFDWTAEKLYTLSDQTQKVVSELKKDVRIIHFERAGQSDPLRDQVADYRRLSRHVTYEAIDAQERRDAAIQFGVKHQPDVVVTSGGKIEHLDEANEQTLTSAILKVTRDSAKVVCMIEGHGEASIESNEAEGFAGVQKSLQDENFKVKPVNLVRAGQVPAECSVTILAGPKNALFPAEADMLTKYLDGGGKAMLLVDPDTDPGLGPLFASWNIDVGKNTVIDVSGVGRLIGLGPAVPLVTQYGSHPVTKNFDRRTMTFFPLARSVKAADKQKSPTVTELLMTSEESWGETNVKENGGHVKFDPGEDLQGPVCLGVATEKSQEGKPARLVVIGNSRFVTNEYFRNPPNRDLFLNGVEWLTLEEDLITIRPKLPTNRRVTLTIAQQNTFFWFSLVAMPGAVLVTGFVLWWKRR
jgi:ABC-type uncharacterized transport system involved in gliding motility auxiliary subunit